MAGPPSTYDLQACLNPVTGGLNYHAALMQVTNGERRAREERERREGARKKRDLYAALSQHEREQADAKARERARDAAFAAQLGEQQARWEAQERAHAAERERFVAQQKREQRRYEHDHAALVTQRHAHERAVDAAHAAMVAAEVTKAERLERAKAREWREAARRNQPVVILQRTFVD